MPEARKAVAPPGTKCAQGERADMPQGWLTVAEEVRPLAIPLRTTFWRGGRKCAFDVHRNRRWLNRTWTLRAASHKVLDSAPRADPGRGSFACP